eukprot:scaffold122_cov236-Pinguiococcus_pyrenoidosus.AAC.3
MRFKNIWLRSARGGAAGQVGQMGLSLEEAYGVLELAEGASEAEVKKAYRRKALLTHPDKNKAPDAAAQFQRVSAAYKRIVDGPAEEEDGGADEAFPEEEMFAMFNALFGDFMSAIGADGLDEFLQEEDFDPLYDFEDDDYRDLYGEPEDLDELSNMLKNVALHEAFDEDFEPFGLPDYAQEETQHDSYGDPMENLSSIFAIAAMGGLGAFPVASVGDADDADDADEADDAKLGHGTSGVGGARKSAYGGRERRKHATTSRRKSPRKAASAGAFLGDPPSLRRSTGWESGPPPETDLRDLSENFGATEAVANQKLPAGELGIDRRVLVWGKEPGTLRFCGDVHYARGTWYGVELDRAAGKNSGTIKGVQYFKARPNHGIMVRSADLMLVPAK